MKTPPKLPFLKDQSGTTVPLFALLLTAMMTTIGGAVDIGQAISMRMKLQQALDAATVAVCTRGDREPGEVMRSYLEEALGQFGRSLQDEPQGANAIAPAPTGNQVRLQGTEFDAINGQISPQVDTSLSTTMLKLVGIDTIDVWAKSAVKCGSKRLELSLVMDITGSMDERVNGVKKIDSLKQAANDVLDIFQYNIDAGATKIALVPFSETVNVGSTYAPRVRGTPLSGTSTTTGMTKYRHRNQDNEWQTWNISNCVSERTTIDKWTDNPPLCVGPLCTSKVGNVYTSNGQCAPTNQLVPLSTDRAMLRNQVNAYQPSGYTAGHIGAAWGWYVLSPRWSSVWTNNVPEDHNPEELIKATIIMTDGEFNTQYRDGVQDRYHKNSANNGSSNYQFEEICKAMKDPKKNGSLDDGIVVYTVGFGLDPNGATAQRLKSCASDNTKFFFPYNGEQLRAAFRSIGNQLAAGQAGAAIVQE
ncbi:MAG: TadE/TadG family type IV pilus assembly protein [Hyphomicrobiaceae bacterium]|nr:TadE/TadG family type IV pilus assembly protein [Hyphomicrobiaceae bacterium]